MRSMMSVSLFLQKQFISFQSTCMTICTENDRGEERSERKRETEREGAKQEQEIFGKRTGNVCIVSHRQSQCQHSTGLVLNG